MAIVSQFNRTFTELMSEEEANAQLVDSFYNATEASELEHEMLVDSVQILALGGITLGRVAGQAIADAKKLGSYDLGRVFDLFTEDQLRYGQSNALMTQAIQADDIVTTGMTYAGKYLKSRVQIQLNSALKTTADGRQYFEYIRRDHYVTSNVYTGWKLWETKNKVSRTMKLYVKDLANGKFYVEKNGVRTAVALGTTETYDVVLNAILATGIVTKYESALNTIPQDIVEELANDQQVLFLNVFKAIKSIINPIA